MDLDFVVSPYAEKILEHWSHFCTSTGILTSSLSMYLLWCKTPKIGQEMRPFMLYLQVKHLVSSFLSPSCSVKF